MRCNCRQSMFRAGGAAADQDADLTYAEAAERLAKKRVAFKDNLVDVGEKGRRGSVSPRRSFSASPHSPNQDLSATPAGTHTPPRANRFGPRGMPGGVGAPGKRPSFR